MAALTAYYNNILGNEATTNWGFNLTKLYAGAVQADSSSAS